MLLLHRLAGLVGNTVERFSRDSTHLKHSNSCPRSSNSKILEFPSTFIKFWYACEELESNAKCSSFGVYFIDVRNMHDCYMKFDYVRISLTHEKYWYNIRDVLVPILHARCEELVPILHGVKITKCEIYGSTKHSLLTISCFVTLYTSRRKLSSVLK